MLSLFRTNQFVANIFLLLYAAIVRMASFVLPGTEMPNNGGVLADWIYQWVDPISRQGAILAFFLIFIQAVLINIILSRHRMASELSLLPGMFYIFVASSISEFLYLSPALMATTFYLFALSEMLDTYKKYTAAGNIFNIGLSIGVGSLFYPSLVVFLLLAIIGLRTLRAFQFNELLILLSGFFAAYFLAFVWFFFIDQYPYFIDTQIAEGFTFLDFQLRGNDWFYYAKLIFFALLIVLILLSFNRFLLKKNIEIQKDITVLYWSILIALLSVLVQSEVGLNHLLLTAPALGILLSFYFLRMSRPMAEAVHLLLLFCVLLIQFQSWWLQTG